MPYLNFEEFFPKPYEIRLYFKSSNGSRPKPDELGKSKLTEAFDRHVPPKKPLNALDPKEKKLEGWELHVLYIKGVSVLEVYKKTHEVNQFEIKHLLGLQSGGSFWKEKTSLESEADTKTALGFDLFREDGYLRSKRLSSRAIMIFRTQTDEFFLKSMEKENFELAPESVKGF